MLYPRSQSASPTMAAAKKMQSQDKDKAYARANPMDSKAVNKAAPKVLGRTKYWDAVAKQRNDIADTKVRKRLNTPKVDNSKKEKLMKETFKKTKVFGRGVGY